MASNANQPFIPTSTGLFDATQWSNPYSLYNNQALPWPSQTTGTPVDAYGNPIQSYVDANNAAQAQYQQQLAAYNAQKAAPASTPGTTLNSTPGATTGTTAPWNKYTNPTGALPGQPYSSPAAIPASAIPAGETSYSVYAQQPDVQYNALVASMTPAERGGAVGQMAAMQNYNTNMGAMQQPAAVAAATAPTPPNMSAAYMSALANPGPLRSVGATVPQSSATTQPGPGVLENFLANWKPQTSGPGSGFTQAFSQALRGK